jgi:hypothetical protein
MPRHREQHIVEERTSGYITRKRLEDFLGKRYNVATFEDFEITVWFALSSKHAWLSSSKEKQNKWEFWAPDKIPEVCHHVTNDILSLLIVLPL